MLDYAKLLKGVREETTRVGRVPINKGLKVKGTGKHQSLLWCPITQLLLNFYYQTCQISFKETDRLISSVCKYINIKCILFVTKRFEVFNTGPFLLIYKSNESSKREIALTKNISYRTGPQMY